MLSLLSCLDLSMTTGTQYFIRYPANNFEAISAQVVDSPSITLPFTAPQLPARQPSFWIAQVLPQAVPVRSFNPWLYSTGLLTLALIGLGGYSYLQTRKLKKQLKFESYKNRELQKLGRLPYCRIIQ